MNVNKVLTKDYEKKSNWTLGENEPKTNPIKANQSQLKPIKANKMPKQTQYEPNQTQFQRQKMLLLMTINGRRKPYTSPTTGAWSNPGPARGQFAKVDPEDYERLAKHKWHINRGRRTLYAVRAVRLGKGKKQKIIKMHREILKTNDDRYIDHINHKGLDNRKANLRPVSRAENVWNMRKRKVKCSSKYIGVSWFTVEKKWQARIQTNGRKIFIGCFNNEVEAAKAYDGAAGKYHGEFAVLNFESPRRRGPSINN